MVQQTPPGACFVLSWSYNSLAVSTVHSSCAVFGLQCASCLPAETRCWAVLCAACYVTGWSLIPRPDAVYTIITHMSPARVLHPIISCKILHSTESFPSSMKCWTQGAIYQDYGKWLQSLSPAGEDDVDHPNDAQGQSWRCWECSSCPRLSSPTPLCYLTCGQSYLQLLSVLSYLCSILLVSSVNSTAVCVHLLSLPIS